jgi:phosphocarrier protein
MFSQKAVIRNKQGIHCRPSALIAKEARLYSGSIRVSNDEGMCEEARNVLGLLSLGLCEGRIATINVSGPDEDEIGRHMVELFETHFDFPPQS